MNEKGSNLGKYLRSLRQANTLSLRAVEKETGVSNGMLSQLESGKVKQPSPVILYKLAQLYGVPYEGLMEKAGYPAPKTANPHTQDASGPFQRFGVITRAEEEALFEYLAFIRSRTGRRRGEP